MVEQVHLEACELERLTTLVQRIVETLDCSGAEAVKVIEAAVLQEGQARKRVRITDFVAQIRKLRLQRNQVLGASLFRDPAWDMLLELFAVHEERRDVSVSSLCLASGVPTTTALRHIDRLAKQGMLYHVGDPTDERRFWVRPTKKAINGIGAFAALLADAAGNPFDPSGDVITSNWRPA